jgi:hypothetical protein
VLGKLLPVEMPKDFSALEDTREWEEPSTAARRSRYPVDLRQSSRLQPENSTREQAECHRPGDRAARASDRVVVTASGGRLTSTTVRRVCRR